MEEMIFLIGDKITIGAKGVRLNSPLMALEVESRLRMY
jgi:hypothetical protein